MTQDVDGGIKLIRKSVDQNYPAANFFLGGLYIQDAFMEGSQKSTFPQALRILRVDVKQGIECYRRAAMQNYSSAQFALAMFYAQGAGVPQDFIEAYAWCSTSLETGLGLDGGLGDFGSDNLGSAEIKRLLDKIKANLTQIQLEQGERRKLELRRLVDETCAENY